MDTERKGDERKRGRIYLLVNRSVPFLSRYGAELDDPQYYQDGKPARITAHQFASIHLTVLAEQLPQPADADGSGSDLEQLE